MIVRSFIRGGMIAFFAANCASVFAASDTSQCRVMDPTGTPLNVRTSPFGRIIGNLPNDMFVNIIDHAIDRTGKAWVYISKSSDGKPVGWVFREFISCS
jgi:Bacterial SH3 domain